jgi:hypothetical protein
MIRPGFLSSADRIELEACVRRQREDHGIERWSRNFGPFVKMDLLMREMIQNDEEKEPRARVQGQGRA